MTKKVVLIEAVRKLEILNKELREKIAKGLKENIADNYRRQIAKNDSMILDYKYRIENE